MESENIPSQDLELELKRQLGPEANCSVSQSNVFEIDKNTYSLFAKAKKNPA